MNSLKKIGTLLIIAFSICLSSSVEAGTKDGGGGNFNAAAIMDYARGALELILKTGKIEPKIKRDAQKILNVAREEVRIDMVEGPLYLNGARVDAINYPDSKMIQIDEAQAAKKSVKEQIRLMLHELAGLAEVPDKNYYLSGLLVQQSIFPITCTAHLWDETTNSRTAEVELLPYSSGTTALRWSGYLNEIQILVMVDLDSSGRISNAEITTFEFPDKHPVRSNTRFLSYGWTGRMWAHYDSYRYPGQNVSITCKDGTNPFDSNRSSSPIGSVKAPSVPAKGTKSFPNPGLKGGIQNNFPEVLKNLFQTSNQVDTFLLKGKTSSGLTCEVITCTAPSYGLYNISGVRGEYKDVDPNCTGSSPAGYTAQGLRLDARIYVTKVNEPTLTQIFQDSTCNDCYRIENGQKITDLRTEVSVESGTGMSAEKSIQANLLKFTFDDFGTGKKFDCQIHSLQLIK